MYSATRPALRASTRRPPDRSIRRRRYPWAHLFFTRWFHYTRSLSHNNPTPPPSIDPDRKPIDSNNGADKKTRDVEKATTESSDTQVATEDPEMLAQKLQRSKEMTRRYSQALRRSQRRNRGNDLPPVVVPGWFLRQNVLLHDELQPRQRNESSTRAEPTALNLSLSLQRHVSEDVSTCSIPVGTGTLPGHLKLLDHFLYGAWRSGLSNTQRKRIARQLASSIGAADNESVIQALERGEDPEAAVENMRDQIIVRLELLKQQLAEAKKLIQHSKDEQLVELKASFLDQEEKLERAMRDYEALTKLKLVNKRYQVPPFVLAEIQATIVASLSALQPTSSDTFPSAKTNLILHSPSNDLDSLMARTVLSIASELGSDVITLHAQDLAEIAGDYLGESLDPSPHSIRSLGYNTYRLSSELGDDIEEARKDDQFGDEQDDAAAYPPAISPFIGSLPRPSRSRLFYYTTALQALTKNSKFIQLTAPSNTVASNEVQPRTQTQAEAQLEDLKLANMLESLIDSPETKRSRVVEAEEATRRNNSSKNKFRKVAPTGVTNFFDFSVKSTADKINIATALPIKAMSKFNLDVNINTSAVTPKSPPKSRIIYIRDFKELNATSYGSRIVQKLEELVRKQRNAGESVMIVGSTCSQDLTPEFSASAVQSLQSENEAGFFRTIVVPVESAESTRESTSFPTSTAASITLEKMTSTSEKNKFRNINLRHIQDMLRCLDPVASQYISDREKSQDDLRASASLFPESYSWKVLTYDEVHRIALTALGLHLVNSTGDKLGWSHVALAMGLLKGSDETKYAYVKRKAKEQKEFDSNNEQWQKDAASKVENELTAKPRGGTAITRRERERQLEAVMMTSNKHEKRLMPGIANPDQIKTTFDHVHVPKETVDSIRTLTSLSFLRPDAFNYGVLATEKISGALLYGPPGTGKTLLAKAVAKESGCTVLEVSGSQIMDKYVGEGEKNVTAVFSLARKLSPCIVFLDEADAIFSSRDVSRERSSHRDILNQFLKEWDGLNDLSVFVMVATNRPFDLDDAVIRRLPRRLLVDLPTQADRKEILKIHLQGEQLDSSVDFDDLGKRTPFYSGSDLKNLAVSAALACVREENEQSALAVAQAAVSGSMSSASQDPAILVRGQSYVFPEKRVLAARHFDKALQEISASISEDMTSLNAIKKFDEKYGDKKGKKKRSQFGIGVNTEVNEDVARVRT